MHVLYKLLHYAINHRLIDDIDYDYSFNRLIKKLNLELEYQPYQTINVKESIGDILKEILDIGVKQGLIQPDTTKQRDLFEAELMDVFTPLPSRLQKEFDALFSIDHKKACDMFYQRSIHSHYIKMDRIEKNDYYAVDSPYGKIEITINLSKPEKDPRDIAKKTDKSDYPKCLLCKENVGYYGRANHPGRSNHRIIKLSLNNEPFYMQYSPYVYYNEHTIVFHQDHIPMKIGLETFKRLFDFVDMFPSYFLGSNAGLPIVGGSILSHEHYQGGRANFPIDNAKSFYETNYNQIKIECLNWPLSVVRLTSENRQPLIEFVDEFRQFFDNYSNRELGLLAHSNGQKHNAINPILRKVEGKYVLLIALRNNLTNETYPDGIYHPHPQRHHIKKENIGLIEVMGLAILPGRLQKEFKEIETYLNDSDKDIDLGKHINWANELQKSGIKKLVDIKKEAGKVFVAGLEDCGIFKQNQSGKAAFKNFIKEFLSWDWKLRKS